MIVEIFTSVDLHCGLKSPVFSKQTFCIHFVDRLDPGRDFLTLRSPNTASPKSTHVIVMQYGNNNGLSFNHISGARLLSCLTPFLSHVITLLLDISSLTRINNNCWKTTVFNLRKGIAK